MDRPFGKITGLADQEQILFKQRLCYNIFGTDMFNGKGHINGVIFHAFVQRRGAVVFQVKLDRDKPFQDPAVKLVKKEDAEAVYTPHGNGGEK